METGLAVRDDVPEEELLRAHFYGLLSRLMAGAPDAEALGQLRDLTGDESELGQAIDALARVARETTPEQAAEEYNVLFVGFGAGGELFPYASHYLTGFLYEKPLADLRGTLETLGVQPDEALTEPEDHMFFVCEVMHGLITGTFGTPASLDVQRRFFESHLRTWGGEFFKDLESAGSARLYMPIGTIGRLFLDIEKDAFEMAAD